MAGESKRKLRLTTIVYWVLLSYIIAALVWWFFSLNKQNQALYEQRRDLLHVVASQGGGVWADGYDTQLARIEKERRRNVAKYIGEGGTFFILILIGAVFIYRSVRGQLRAQQQQQNFMMAVTHELKTPIAVSRLNLETLQRYRLDEARREKLLQISLQETMRLDSLINNILLSSQLEGHSYEIAKEPLDLSQLVEQSAQQFSGRYTERKLVTGIEKNIGLNGDPLLLKLLVSNLLENANKYSPKDKPVTLTLHTAGGRTELEVKDEGPGIDRAERKNIFKKFYRVGNEQTRRTKGTGLGLYLCRKIAADHGGRIRVEDNQPQGSNFIVSFPA